jgi:cysteine-S-conjugate beta-lyase
VDFDRHIERRHTASFKWDLYPGDVLPLWVADMDFASPPPVTRALEARARHEVFGYSMVPESLVQAIVAHLEARYGWRIDPKWLVWLPSVVPGLNLACSAFAAPDEAVLTITPVYPPFLEAPGGRGRRLVTVPAELRDGHWELPLEALQAAVTPDTRVLLLCHPHNPLGRVWRPDEVEQLIAFCRRHDLVLVSDEIHCDLILDDLAHVPAALAGPDDGDRIVTLMSPSKTFNLPGLNFAFAIVSDEALRRRFEQPAAGLLPFPGCFAIAGAEAAYREGAEWLAELLTYLRGNRDLVEAFVAAELPRLTMTHVEATYLAWLDVGALGLDDPAAACRAAGVALSAGSSFGDPACLRLNFACRRALLEEALERLRGVLA